MQIDEARVDGGVRACTHTRLTADERTSSTTSGVSSTAACGALSFTFGQRVGTEPRGVGECACEKGLKGSGVLRGISALCE